MININELSKEQSISIKEIERKSLYCTEGSSLYIQKAFRRPFKRLKGLKSRSQVRTRLTKPLSSKYRKISHFFTNSDPQKQPQTAQIDASDLSEGLKTAQIDASRPLQKL